MNANVGLAIQCVGIILVTVLTVSMGASIRSASLQYWTFAWLCLAISLCSLFIGFHVAEYRVFYSLYFLGEYAFGLLFIAGCREHVSAQRPRQKHLYLLLPATALAIGLPFWSGDFNDLFMVQATIMSVLFAAAFVELRPALKIRRASPGLRVMAVALILLAIDFLHYVPVFGARKGFWGLTIPSGYLQYTSIFDLILEILLGFGTVMVLMEGVRREVEVANVKLIQAHDKLELLAQMDPLTEALNRHAFHSLMSRGDETHEANASGCVAVIDVDNLKAINDSLGHNVGDRAIRAVARAIRSLIRADDMLFRWGGDEFLVLMYKLEEAEATKRMHSLNENLAQNSSQWNVPVEIKVSFGVAGFGSMRELGPAIENADKAMYRKRHETRRPKEMELVGSE